MQIGLKMSTKAFAPRNTNNLQMQKLLSFTASNPHRYGMAHKHTHTLRTGEIPTDIDSVVLEYKIYAIKKED